MPTRKPKKKRAAAGSRGKTSKARSVPSKRKKPSAKKQPARKVSPARATKKGGTKRAGANQAKGTSTKARPGKQTVTRKAGAAISQALNTVRKALDGVMTAVTAGPSPAGTGSPETSGEQPGREPGR